MLAWPMTPCKPCSPPSEERHEARPRWTMEEAVSRGTIHLSRVTCKCGETAHFEYDTLRDRREADRKRGHWTCHKCATRSKALTPDVRDRSETLYVVPAHGKHFWSRTFEDRSPGCGPGCWSRWRPDSPSGPRAYGNRPDTYDSALPNQQGLLSCLS